MRTSFFASGVAILAIAGCSESRPPGPPVPLRSFELRDIQVLWGGVAIWASEDQSAIVQIVKQREGQGWLQESRYKFKLAEGQWAEVERLVGAHNFFLLEMPPFKSSVPDRAVTSILVVSQSGEVAKAKKRSDETNRDLDPFVSFVRGMCRPQGKPIYDGPFDPDWRPDGFEQP
jgi:hypothetical protein